MMILHDAELLHWIYDERGIQPPSPELINPASVDLRLGLRWRYSFNPHHIWKMGVEKGLPLYPLSFTYKWLGRVAARNNRPPPFPTYVMVETLEQIYIPTKYSAEVKMKTTPTREGLGQVIADYVDPGYQGILTLMLYAIKPTVIHYAEPICQIVVQQLSGQAASYGVKGHYQNQTKPTLSWRQRDE